MICLILKVEYWNRWNIGIGGISHPAPSCLQVHWSFGWAKLFCQILDSLWAAPCVSNTYDRYKSNFFDNIPRFYNCVGCTSQVWKKTRVFAYENSCIEKIRTVLSWPRITCVSKMIHMQLNVLISIGTKYINAQNLLDCFIYLFSIIIEPLLFTRYTLYRYIVLEIQYLMQFAILWKVF